MMVLAVWLMVLVAGCSSTTDSPPANNAGETTHEGGEEGGENTGQQQEATQPITLISPMPSRFTSHRNRDYTAMGQSD